MFAVGIFWLENIYVQREKGEKRSHTSMKEAVFGNAICPNIESKNKYQTEAKMHFERMANVCMRYLLMSRFECIHLLNKCVPV